MSVTCPLLLISSTPKKKDLAQRLTTALCISIGNIHIYVETRRDDAEYTDVNWGDATFVTQSTIAGNRCICHRVCMLIR